MSGATPSDPTGVPPLVGIDVDSVTEWYRARVPGTRPPLSFVPIEGGLSNLTYLVTDAAGARTVLRRPPLGDVLASAHDMGREHRIVVALAGHVPVPPVFGPVADDSVNGAPFYVMDFVPGTVPLAPAHTAAMAPEVRWRAGVALVETLAAIHAVDVDGVGLGDLGRREGYVSRQLRRWYGQWDKTRTRDLPAIDRVHDVLAAHVPTQGPATLVHGDYKLDNCIIDESGEIAAVLDWELCTLGDPLADLGTLLTYWAEPEDEHSVLDAPTTTPGMLRRDDVVEIYERASGRDVRDAAYFTALGCWKLACILEGVYARHRGGSMGARDERRTQSYRDQVDHLAARAEATLEQHCP